MNYNCCYLLVTEDIISEKKEKEGRHMDNGDKTKCHETKKESKNHISFTRICENALAMCARTAHDD